MSDLDDLSMSLSGEENDEMDWMNDAKEIDEKNKLKEEETKRIEEIKR